MKRGCEGWRPRGAATVTWTGWIESAAPVAPRAARRSRRRPRHSESRSWIEHSGRVLAALAGGRRRIVEVGTAFGLLHALDGARAAVRRDHRDDRPRHEADRTGRGLVAGRPGSPTSGSCQAERPALDALDAGDPAWPGRSTWPSSMPLKHEYAGLPGRLLTRSAGSPRAPWSWPTTCCGAAASPASARRRAPR